MNGRRNSKTKDKMEKPKKTLYHSELAGLGQVVIDITDEVRKSKFAKAGEQRFYVPIILNGHVREYNVENPACGEALRGRKGQRCTVEAAGSREEATVTVLSAEWTAECAPQAEAGQPVKPAAAKSQPKAAQAARPAAGPAPDGNQKPAQQRQNTPPTTGQILTKLTNMLILCELAAHKCEATLREQRGFEATPEQHQGHVGMLFIQMTRDGHQHSQPGDHILDIRPKEQA